jgi:F-type H+-transporting ATPase subunit alpha
VNGYLDKLPVAKVSEFEKGLLSELRDKGSAILDAIRSSGDLASDTESKLKETVESFAKAFG